MRSVCRGRVVVGREVYTPLYGRGTGYVCEIIGESDPVSAQPIAGVGVAGGKAQYGIVFADGTKTSVPEAILRAAAPYSLYPDRGIGAAELQALLDNAERVACHKAAREAARRQAFDVEAERLKTAPEYAALTQRQDSDKRHNQLARDNPKVLL